jgi:exonuclease III
MSAKDDHSLTNNDNNNNNNKRQKTSHESNDDDDDNTFVGQCHPKTFVTWNCNGLTSRAKWNVNELQRLLQETKYPDMICLQEVRLKASGPEHQRGKPSDSEYQGPVQKVLEEQVFSDYHRYWSLADTKYSGTLTLIHKRCFMKRPNNDNIMIPSSSTDFVAFTPQSAIDLMLRKFGKTREECGISSATVSSSTTISTSSPQKKTTQTSMKSFFEPKKPSSATITSKSSSSSGLGHRNHQHHSEGRFQFFCFRDMDVIQTYVPNNGTKDESFEKRRQWDNDMLRFFRDRQSILSKCNSDVEDRKLLWCGDMNVAHTYQDGTNWEERQKKNDGDADIEEENADESSTTKTIYEYWTDESKCFVQSDNKNPTRNKRPENVGIPGFTSAERRRFSSLLQEANLCDVWRYLHPNGVATTMPQNNDNNGGNAGANNYKTRWDLPNYTWRGHTSKVEGKVAKYQGKGQRLDCFLLSPSHLLVSQNDGKSTSIVKSCEILGYGERKEGLFCGSDHCAVLLELK